MQKKIKEYIAQILDSVPDNEKWREPLQKQLERYEEIIEFSQLVGSSLDAKTLFKKINNKVKKLIECDSLYLFKWNEKSNAFVFKNPLDKTFEYIKDENTFVGSCAHFAAVIEVLNVPDDIRSPRENHWEKGSTGTMVLAPVISKGEVLGVIQINNPKYSASKEDDIYFLEIFSSIVGHGFENINLFEKLQDQFLEVCHAFGDAIVKKDNYTGGHAKRVGHFSEMIGREMNLSNDEIVELGLSAALHDLGKIGIDDNLLRKSSPLTESEFEIMKNHPRYGFEILGHVHGLKDVVDGMHYHHEKHDGTGYPEGLKGDEIPWVAKIISVADTFDAMISTRPYRKGLPPMEAYKEILSQSGKQFSPDVVKAFKKGFEKTSMYKIGIKKKKAS
jgi:HD-GYP domain-containing protein (c-di-GMP phosphodiesterase class II)